MRTHVQVIGWLNIILGVLTAIAGVVAASAFGFLGVLAAADGQAEALPLFGALGGFVSLVLFVTAVPSILVGIGLLSFAPWARVVAIVLSILHLVNASTLGLSTVLGVYSLVILFLPETARLFERRGGYGVA